MRSLVDEVPFDIPDSWEWCRFSSLITLLSGTSYQKNDVCNSGIRILRGGNIQSYKLILEDSDVFLPLEYRDEEKNIQPGDTILVASTGSKAVIGKPAFVDKEYPNTQIGAFLRIARPIDPIIADYIALIFETEYYREHIRHSVQGTNINNIKAEYIENLLIPLPPHEEQVRVLAKLSGLEPALVQYDNVENTLQSLNASFPEALKKSILQEAVQGKLVPQDPSDEPAEALLERIRAEKQRLIKEGKIKKDKHESVIFRRDNSHYEKRGSEEVCIDDEIPFEIPENWTWTRLKYICSLIGDIDHNMPKSVSSDVGVLFLSAKDLLDDGTINYTQNAKYISRADFERLSRKALPQKHDIIYSRIGAALGKARLVEIDREFLVSYSCCVVRPLLVYAPYIRYYLESPQILLHSIKARQSIGVPDLGMGEIKKYLVALPPYNEQVRIVEQLEVLLDRCDFKK